MRFLLINSNFLEEIGVDMDVFLNLGNAGFNRTGTVDPVTGRNILIPRANPGPNNRTTPFPINLGSFEGARSEATSVAGSLGGPAAPIGFSLSGSFLDNIQVDFLISATHAYRRTKSNVAPHVTVFNGEQATVSFQVQQNYVASLTAVTDNRVGLVEPEIAQANTGINLIITPTISADKRYVGLNIEVIQEAVLAFETFTFNTAGGDTLDTTDQGGLIPGLGSTSSTGTIQEPTIEVNQIQTHVSVPDGGTLLLGGQKVTAEIEKEVGVPILSKIPLLNRLFSNRSETRDESILLILIKPTIILQKEEEDLRFGSLTEVRQ